MNIITEINKELNTLRNIRRWILILERAISTEGASSVDLLLYSTNIDEDVVRNITMSLYNFRKFSDKYLPEVTYNNQYKSCVNELSRWIYLVQEYYLYKTEAIRPNKVAEEVGLDETQVIDGIRAISNEIEYLEKHLVFQNR